MAETASDPLMDNIDTVGQAYCDIDIFMWGKNERCQIK